MDKESCLLLQNIDKIHTTELGVERIKKNLGLDTQDPVAYCISLITSQDCVITKVGKNWYAEKDNCVITVNSYNYVIITAHKKKNIKEN